MRKIILYIASSLDGKIAGSNDELDWLPVPDEKTEDYGYNDFLKQIGVTLSGYKTYKISEGFGEFPYKDKENFVFTRDSSKPKNEWVQLISGDIVKFVSDLKQKPGKDIWLIGGGEIVTILYNAKLIDDYIITVIPIILGKGIPMFTDLKLTENLKLKNSIVFKDGVVQLVYERKD